MMQCLCLFTPFVLITAVNISNTQKVEPQSSPKSEAGSSKSSCQWFSFGSVTQAQSSNTDALSSLQLLLAVLRLGLSNNWNFSS